MCLVSCFGKVVSEWVGGSRYFYFLVWSRGVSLFCWLFFGSVGTFIVVRMFWRSFSWMGWVGLVAVLVLLFELGAGFGLVIEVVVGVEGVGVARAEEAVEDGVIVVDWFRELGRVRVVLEWLYVYDILVGFV